MRSFLGGLIALLLIGFGPAYAQPKPPGPSGTQIVIGTTPIPNGTNGNCLTINGKVVGQAGCGGGGGGGTVTSIATTCGVSGGTITTTGTIQGATAVRAVTGTTDTILAADCGGVVTENNAGAVAVTLPQATGSFGALFSFTLINLGAGTVTITPTTSTINGASTLTLGQGQSSYIISDGANYQTAFGRGVTSIATSCGATGGTITATGTIKAQELVNSQAGTTYTVADGDCGKLLQFTNAGAVAVSLPQAGAASQFAAGWLADFQSIGAGGVVITATTSTISGAAICSGSVCTLPQNQGFRIVSDGANYQVALTGVASGGTVTSVTCPGATITTSGTCAIGYQLVTGTSGSFVKINGAKQVVMFACGGGGQGGGGATVVSGTVASGGAGGGGADCHWASFASTDVTNSTAITIGQGGTSGGQGSSTAGGAVGSTGQAGSNTSFGSLQTWFGGGGGGGGSNAAAASTSGGGAGPWAVGQNANTAVSRGCTLGGGTSNGTNQAACGGPGGGSSAAGAATNGGYSNLAAPGGSSGGGVSAAPAGIAATAVTGGGSLGCQSPPSGGAIGTNGGTAVAPDFTYHAGCGGAGGGGQVGNTGTPGNGTAGTSGGGGGGGGSVCSSGGSCTAQNGGSGGAGGNGFLAVWQY